LFRFHFIIDWIFHYFYNMQKIATFIMQNKKYIPLVILLTFIAVFFSFQSQGKNEEDPKRYEKILRNLNVLIKEAHFKPRAIDDAFSKTILKSFVEELDDEKNIFLASDIEAFKKYENKIDDEINGASLVSFYEIYKVYQKRIKEVEQIYPTLLSSPFNFNDADSIQMDVEKNDFPKTENDRYDIWRKRMKYAVLSKLVDAQEEQDKNKANKELKDFKLKADSTMEREARDQVKKQMTRYYTTKSTNETQDELFSIFVNSITMAIDPHTNYYPPIASREFNESMSGRFYGIGAQLKEEDGHIKIGTLVSGGPAWKGGELKENDEIIKVAQGAEVPVDVTGYSVSDAVKLIRGSSKGSEVRLTVKRIDGSIHVIKIIRDEVKLESTFARSAIINGKNKIGYIYLPEFYADFERPNGARCAVDIAKEIDKLKAENVSGIILDLRGNGGGSLYDVVQMAGLFIKNGPVCQVKGRDESPNILKDKDDKIQYTGPLAVMVDGTSASASEIFAAAIQDYKRGIIIGANSTYGKGTVQRMISLNPDGELSILADKNAEDLGNVKITLQKFYRINGGATQLRGVVPDVILPDRYDFLKYREKDVPSALGWDEIPKAVYNVENNDFNTIVNEEKNELAKNERFSKLKKSLEQLNLRSKKAYSLNINQYKLEQKAFKSLIKEIDELSKLSKSLEFKNLASDTATINSAQDKIDNNKQWMKFRVNDIYINESVNVIEKMISQNNLVKFEGNKP
jgi:carboxyl-terminal processing protease